MKQLQTSWSDLSARIKVLTLMSICCLAAGCSTAYRAIPVPAPADRVPHSDAWHNEDYERLLAAISTVMVRELNLPRIQGVVLFYSNYRTYEVGLAEETRTGSWRVEERGRREGDAESSEQIAAWARQRAFATAGVAINDKVLIREISLRRYSVSRRMHVLAHEVAHLLQHALAGGSRVRWEAWLVEGFAEWVAYKVLDYLKIEAFASSRDNVKRNLAAGSQGEPPALARLRTQSDIIVWAQKTGGSVYDLGMMAADFLIEEKGLPAVLDYFRKLNAVNDREQSFSLAFGETLADFDVRFKSQLKSATAK